MTQKTASIQNIPLGDIVLSGDNKRKIDVEEKSFKTFVANIAACGVRLPVLVRPAKKKGKYELRYGHRRFAASKLIGLETIPAIVIEGLDDKAALQLTYIENKYRQDLKPMEEAAEVDLWMKRMGGNVKAIAETIGKDEKWVRVRAHVHGHLAKCWRDIFANLDNYPMFAGWTVTHLSLIARLPEHIQKSLHDGMKGTYGSKYHDAWSCSTRDLEKMIAEKLHLLSRASWALDDETLIPKAGSCLKCIKRSGHQPNLWFDAEDQANAGDQCLDRFCWQDKHQAWLLRKAKQLCQEHGNMVFITKSYPDYNESRDLSKAFGNYINSECYKTVSKSSKGAIPAMYINGAGAGQLTYINKVNEYGQVSKKSGNGKPTPLKQRRTQLDAKRWAQVLVDLREKIEKTDVGSITYPNHIVAAMTLAAGFGNRSLWSPYANNSKMSRAEIDKLARSNDESKALAYLWESFKPTLDQMLTYNGPITQTPEHHKKDARWIAELIGLDANKMFKEVCGRKGFGEPKSWAALNEDGTSKKAKTVKSKKTKAKGKKKTAAKDGPVFDERKCRECGCTENNACPDDGSGNPCHWVEEDLCSACKEIGLAKAAAENTKTKGRKNVKSKRAGKAKKA